MQQFNLIAIAGIVGVGKTTLARQLSNILSLRLICEEYDTNPFLTRQLAGDRDAALASELFFLLSRARQLARESIAAEPGALCDYIFHKNRIFAELTLDQRQMGIFDEIESIVAASIVTPGIVIFLRDSVENCHQRIMKRARPFETNITAAWLGRLAREYEQLFDRWNACPVLTVDCGEYDVRKRRDARWIAEQLAGVADPAAFRPRTEDILGR